MRVEHPRTDCPFAHAVGSKVQNGLPDVTFLTWQDAPSDLPSLAQ